MSGQGKPGVLRLVWGSDTVGEVWVARSFTALTALESSFARNDGGSSWFLDEYSSKAADFANGIGSFDEVIHSITPARSL